MAIGPMPMSAAARRDGGKSAHEARQRRLRHLTGALRFSEVPGASRRRFSLRAVARSDGITRTRQRDHNSQTLEMCPEPRAFVEVDGAGTRVEVSAVSDRRCAR